MVGQVINETTIQAFTSEASGLKLVGVRPYSNAWLQDRGFYVAQGGRELFGNEGEVSLIAKNGLIYRLFFGEIALGDDQDKVAKVTRDGQAQTGSHNRYLAIFVQYDSAVDETLPKPTYSQAAAPAEGAGGEPVARRADNQDAIDKAIAEGRCEPAKLRRDSKSSSTSSMTRALRSYDLQCSNSIKGRRGIACQIEQIRRLTRINPLLYSDETICWSRGWCTKLHWATNSQTSPIGLEYWGATGGLICNGHPDTSEAMLQK